MSLYNDISSQTLFIIGGILAVVFILIACRLYCDIRFLRKGRNEQQARIGMLRLNDMIARLKINKNKYFARTSDMDRERHIWACEHCPEPESCEHMFEGENLDPHHFCPNIDELERIKGAKSAKQAPV